MKKLAIQLFVIGTIIATYALPVLAVYMGHRDYQYTVKYLKVLDAYQRLGLVNFVRTHPHQP